MTDKIIGRKQRAAEGWGFKATRQGDAIRVDMYQGARKVKNFCYFFERWQWPDEPHNKQRFARSMMCTPTLLKGPSINITAEPAQGVLSDAFVRAVEEVL